MINARDWLLLGLILGSMLVAVILPGSGVPFRPYTSYFLMVLLFLSFLSISVGSIARTAREHGLFLIGLLLVKLLLLPVAFFFLVRAVYPEFALAALLLGGIPTGVLAPFFSTLVHANTSLAVLMVTAGSVLVPFTLPVLVRALVGQTLDISFTAMAGILAQMIFIPLAASELLRRISFSFTEKIVALRYYLSLFFCVVLILGVFSKYADFLRQNPSIVIHAFVVSVGVYAALFVVGILVSFGRSPADRLAVIISMALINNILVMVFSAGFFGPLEPLSGVTYCVPFFFSVVFLRAFSGWLREDR
jgi:BASS family bile acid:Na+ symporter